MLDAPTRQRHLQLWASRQAADRLLACHATLVSQQAGDSEGKKKKKEWVGSVRTSFAHELSMDPFGFAFGGVDPGTLHAHGKLVKVHTVHYSIGLAGEYKMHVGLRQQEKALPGSPFTLTVEPGHAYAGCSRLPMGMLPLHGVADEGFQNGLVFSTADVLGNVCVKGGANPVMKECQDKSIYPSRSHSPPAEPPAVPPAEADALEELGEVSAPAATTPVDVADAEAEEKPAAEGESA